MPPTRRAVLMGANVVLAMNLTVPRRTESRLNHCGARLKQFLAYVAFRTYTSMLGISHNCFPESVSVYFKHCYWWHSFVRLAETDSIVFSSFWDTQLQNLLSAAEVLTLSGLLSSRWPKLFTPGNGCCLQTLE